MTTNNTNIIYSDLSYEIMGAIFEVHKTLGPGFLDRTVPRKPRLVGGVKGHNIK